ncbi:MAG: helix-turn-helix domain-containing protein [Deltaproteobacteria bacterium]|nr:helix-turn-helix domain-containing protein [Deltaproteobacteria bacterium]
MRLFYADIIGRMKSFAGLKNDSAVAKILGVTPQALSNYKKREKIPTHLVIKFASIYSLSVDWLLYGEGEVKNKDISNAFGETGVIIAAEDSDPYGVEFKKSLDFLKLSSDEMIYLGKVLKVFRNPDKTSIAALKYSIDAFYDTKDK